MSAEPEFAQMAADFAAGKTEAILMHIDTAKLLTREEWELLERSGASVVMVQKTLPEDAD
ncbi:hypothetical protein [Caulobacter segnis]|uniref:Uncharacterized protein n=1 Tax=Caulobacter segnis TaxID=88688 RepID=A0A2W5VD42_9CAUL|nr:hypothetical protein [Caulobacter segnis]PZR33245.1 MAG: hypothetical protein DI526_14215 [Caulobacter segnis]